MYLELSNLYPFSSGTPEQLCAFSPKKRNTLRHLSAQSLSHPWESLPTEPRASSLDSCIASPEYVSEQGRRESAWCTREEGRWYIHWVEYTSLYTLGGVYLPMYPGVCPPYYPGVCPPYYPVYATRCMLPGVCYPVYMGSLRCIWAPCGVYGLPALCEVYRRYVRFIGVM